MSKQVGKFSDAQESRVPPLPVVITAATDVGTNRPYSATASTSQAAAAGVGAAVSLTWTVPAGSLPATSYTITTTPATYTATVTAPATTYTFEGLASNTAYTFTITPVGNYFGNGLSTTSSSVTATTVPQAPTIGTATDQGAGRPYNNGQVSLTFTANATGGKTISSYTVTPSATVGATSVASSPATLTGFLSGGSYSFTVVAVNANGSSLASGSSAAITTTTVPSAPAAPTATDQGAGRPFNNGLASVAFSAPGYAGPGTLSYTVTSSGGQSASGAGSPLSISGLASATGYTYTVTATNSNGTSAASAASAAVTATTVPAQPSPPGGSSPNTSQDIVTWSAPANGGSAITSYYLYQDGAAVGNVGNVTSYTIGEGMGSSHNFEIAAINVNGQGATSGASGQIVTLFSFTPFSPFGFTPFGFTPFGFTPFSPFGFTPWSNSLDLNVKVLTPEGYKYAGDLQVGDTLLALNIEKDSNTDWLDWQTNSDLFKSEDMVETKVVSIEKNTADKYLYVDGDIFTPSHYILVKKDNIVKFTKVTDIDTTYQKYSTKEKKFVDIELIEDVIATTENISIKCEPYRNFFTSETLVFDTARKE